MIIPISIPTGSITSYTTYSAEIAPSVAFPILSIDRGSYIVDAQIHSGINFAPHKGLHSIQIGKYTSIADSTIFLLNLNHPYKNVAQGVLDFFPSQDKCNTLPTKGEIIIGNDVWIGRNCTILGGVTIHNGAVIAANSIVTKDVPPYAIVGGNPAKPIGSHSRFTKEQIEALLHIAWWNWDIDKLQTNCMDFGNSIELFIQKHIESARQFYLSVPSIFPTIALPKILFIPDLNEPCPIWKTVLTEYFSRPRSEYELILYITPEISQGTFSELLEFLESYEDCEANITLETSILETECSLFKDISYFITTRSPNIIRYISYAYLYQVSVLSGISDPIFSILDKNVRNKL